MDVVLAQIFFALLISTTAVHSQIQKGPENALKKVGDSVTLECVKSSNNCDQVEWMKMEGAQAPRTVYRDGIGILNGFPRERYSVSSTVGCSLTITHLRISDSGRFYCTQLIGDKQESRGCVLVVIDVTVSCQPLTSNNELTEGDGYSFSTAINVPAKSVDPSNVMLSFHNMTVDETETVDVNQSQTVKTTLTGIARKETITQRMCRASLPPNDADGFDRSIATIDVCTTQQLIVSYPVEKIVISPTGPYHKGATVLCTADGHPYPTFKWTHLKSGDVVAGDILVINGDDGDQYTCTVTNTVKRSVTSHTMTIEVSAPPQLHGSSIGVGVGIGVSGMMIFICIVFGVLCRRYDWIKRTKTAATSVIDDKRMNENEEDPERSRINMNCSNIPQYEPLNILLSQKSNAEPTYEELTMSTEVDAIGQSLSNRATNENKLNEKDSSLAEYESLQQTQLSPTDAYESIKPKKSDKNKKF